MSYLELIFEKYFTIQSILILAFLSKMLIYTVYLPNWDACSYCLMGKYLFSGGQIGLIEPFRPIVWPVLLGLMWKAGADILIAGKILEHVFSLGSILLVYLIGKLVYEKKTGLLAAFLLTLSPIFFFWSNSLCSETPSNFFGLLAVYLFFREKHFISGMTGAVAVFTRFSQLVPMALLALVHMIKGPGVKPSKEFVKFSTGFILGALLFLIFNDVLYGDMFYPFKEAAKVYSILYFKWYMGLPAIFKVLLLNEDMALLLIPITLPLVIREGINRQRLMVLLAAFFSILWIGKFHADYNRLTITALPYLYLWTANGLVLLYNYFRMKGNLLQRQVLLALVAVVFSVQFYRVIQIRFPKDEPGLFYEYIRAHEDQMKGNIWISNPMSIIRSNLKAAELMYYPLFTLSKVQDLKSKLPSADYILLYTGNLTCFPKEDAECNKTRKELFDSIQKEFKVEYYLRHVDGKNFLAVYKRSG